MKTSHFRTVCLCRANFWSGVCVCACVCVGMCVGEEKTSRSCSAVMSYETVQEVCWCRSHDSRRQSTCSDGLRANVREEFEQLRVQKSHFDTRQDRKLVVLGCNWLLFLSPWSDTLAFTALMAESKTTFLFKHFQSLLCLLCVNCHSFLCHTSRFCEWRLALTISHSQVKRTAAGHSAFGDPGGWNGTDT